MSGLTAGAQYREAPSTTSRFTAPTTSTYDFALRFEGEASGGGGTTTNVAMTSNGSSLFASGINGYGAGSLVTFAGAAQLQAGQTVDIGVTCGVKFTFDSTAIQGTITAVPEPSTAALTLAGLAVLASCWRRCGMRKGKGMH